MGIIEFFGLPFMQRALFAGLAIGAVLPLLGVFVTLRKMSFFGDGVAHASLLGIAIGVVAGLNPFALALVVGVVLGIFIYVLERRTAIASDAAIGVIFTASLALGISIISLESGYQPELLSFLFGNILTIGAIDLWMTFGAALLVVAAAIVFMRQLVLLAFDRESAWVSGVPTNILDFLFYVILSLSIVIGVKLLGILLVSALLIIPPTIAKLLAGSFRQLLALSIFSGECSVVAGLIFSYLLDFPSGAAIILSGTVMLVVALVINVVFRTQSGQRVV